MKLKWKEYYYRAIGYFLSAGGLGLLIDELINGPFKLTLPGHETYGVILFFIGLLFISKKPHGKGGDS